MRLLPQATERQTCFFSATWPKEVTAHTHTHTQRHTHTHTHTRARARSLAQARSHAHRGHSPCPEALQPGHTLPCAPTLDIDFDPWVHSLS